MNRSAEVALLLLRLCALKPLSAVAGGRAAMPSVVGGAISRRRPQFAPSPGASAARQSFADCIADRADPGSDLGSTGRALSLRGGHSPPSISASLAYFAESNPVATAFLSCALNGLAADWIAQRSEAAEGKSSMRRDASANALLRTGTGGGSAAFVANPNDATRGRDSYAADVVDRQSSGVEALNGALSKEPQSFSPSARSSAIVDFRWDARRSLAFVLYGGCYQGVACHAFYNVLFLRWFGPDRAWTKVAVSQFVMAPLLTLPCAYLFRGAVFGRTASETLADYWTGVTSGGLLLSFWKLWIPVQFLIFKVIPTHLRIPFSSLFSFLWTVLLSRMTNRV